MTIGTDLGWRGVSRILKMGILKNKSRKSGMFFEPEK